MYQDNLLRELLVDNFAGGGGASTGIELALGVPVDIAINHNPDAIAMHKVNHPYTRHLQEDVWGVNPKEVTQGRPVGLMWLSPDCTHFSKAKGNTPVKKNIRGLAWVALKWAGTVRPRVIILENVEEFTTWGPIKPIRRNGRCVKEIVKVGNELKYITAEKGEVLSVDQQLFEPDKKRAGQTFNRFVEQLRALGYEVEWRVLKACDYGAPTIRKRFYLIARCDKQPIVWPAPTHGEGEGLEPYRTAADCIDFSKECPSIFDRKKGLAANTLRRIARGLDKFVIKNPQPFIMEMNYANTAQDPNKPMSTQTSANHHYIITPSILQYHSEQSAREVRGQCVDERLMTVDGSPRYALNACCLSKYFSGEKQAGADMNDPLPTVTGVDHNALVFVNLSSRYGDGSDGRGSRIDEPTPTVTGTNHEHLITANIVHYYGGADHASSPDKPIATVTVEPRHYLVEQHLCVLRNHMGCSDLREQFPTVTAKGHEVLVSTYLQKAGDTHNLGKWNEVRELLNKYAGYNIAEDELLIFEINGVQYFITDVGMRMLEPSELMLAQGFPADYCIDIETKIGKKYNKSKQIARLGNAVCPPVAAALVRANVPELAVVDNYIPTMKDLNLEFNKTVTQDKRKKKVAA